MSLRFWVAAALLSLTAGLAAAPAMAGCDLTDPACTATDGQASTEDGAKPSS